MSYIAPVKDMLFCMKELADIESIAKLPGFEDAGLETAQAVLEESARFCQEVLAPLNRDGDVNAVIDHQLHSASFSNSDCSFGLLIKLQSRHPLLTELNK